MVKVKIGIIGGSGLNNPSIMKDGVELVIATPFGSPSDVLTSGTIEGVQCVILPRHGRGHSINPSNVNYRANIWALKMAGCTHVLVSNACGSLREDIRPGDLVIVDSFLDRTKHRKDTFFDGLAGSPPGVVHVPMEPAFCARTRELLMETAKELDFAVHPTGTMVVIEGPRFSSKAESNMYRQLGASVIGMTLVPEVCLAREAGLLYASVAMATDYDCWRDTVVNVKDVLDTFKANVEKVEKIFLKVIPKIGGMDWSNEITALRDLVANSNQSNLA